MSYVTNVLLSFDILEDEAARIGEVNAALARAGKGQQLGNISDSAVYGGTKRMEIPLWGAAFNYLGPADFIEAVRAVEWDYPKNVRVFICDQEDNAFRMVVFS